MDVLKAYWFRFWHCLYYTLIIPFNQKHGLDHRTKTEWIDNKITHIGCCCGKSYYGKSSFENKK